MRRRALLSATAVAASTAALSGCLGDARRQLSGQILAHHASATLRPAEEQWVVGGLSAETNEYARAVLFPESPPRDADLFTDAYPRTEQSFDNEILNEDYENGFTLLYEVKMASEEAFVPLPRSHLLAEAGWTGWTSATLPMTMSRYEESELDEDEREAEELVAISVAYYEADRAPSRAEVTLYDEAGNRRGGGATATPWSSA
ncbi:hypothetical protein [Halopelagius longus]|uniref:Lipoprotein n=1 Tax=Halopelagius longus TaxID=1236180 RepID=A0A1H1ALR7_9EURY|nr:hypothetical protein [Halopelagius longus]RDI70430.1 hypothetical protein DWB78_01125 [Halopelagius longus]SDQ40587.1 hypothetical protein SAMN05216278_1395 [Halopelagius longus]